MACRYTYKGKTYEAHEFDDVLRAMSPSEASAFMPTVQAIPSAPFVTKTDAWVSLAIKRVIHMAATEGYDRVALVTGEQAAERFDLSKQIDDLRYGDGMLVALSGGAIVVNKEAKPEDLPDIVGKEIAERLLKAPKMPGNGYRRLSGLDLKVGGEGMRAFYDKIVPSVLKDVLKKVGGGQARYIAFAPETMEEEPGPTIKQPGFDITPAMREAVSGGMPMFSELPNTDEFRAWSKGMSLVQPDDFGMRGIYRVYHATPYGFDAFKPGGLDPTLSGPAIWLSPYADKQPAAHNVSSRTEEYRSGARVLPLYARLERPLVLDSKDMKEWAREVFAGGSNEFPMLMAPKWVEEIKKEYDGILYDGEAMKMSDFQGGFRTREIIVFNPNQVKSVFNQRPTDDDRINFSDYETEKASFGRNFLPGQRAPKKLRAADLKTGNVKSDAAVTVLTRAVDSEYPIINAVRKANSAVGEAWKQAVEALPGRTADAVNQARAAVIEPLYTSMGEAAKKLKVRPAQLVDAYGIYRLARHAAERNATLRANGSKKANPSGMSEQEAGQWWAFFNSEPDLLRALQSFDPMIKAIQDYTDQVKMDAGLLTQDDIDARSDWKWYINLQGDPGADETGGHRGGGGWNSDIDPKAKGRDSLSANPVVNTVKVLENAIRLAEMARVKKATYEFAVAHPDVIGAKVETLFARPFFDENGNFAKAVPNRDRFDTNAVVYRNGDREYWIQIGDSMVAEALKRMERENTEIIARGLGKLTRLMGRLWTQFSPHFPLVNFIRDLQQQLAYIAGSKVVVNGRKLNTFKAAWMIASRYPMTFGAAASEVFGRAPSGKYTRLARELVANGGVTGWTKMLNDEESLSEFVKEVKWKAGKAVTSLLWNKFVDVVGDISQVFELTTRVAAYSVMKDLGMDSKSAANFTLNLMNFNKAGTSTKAWANAYMFLKPSVQDVYLTSKLLRQPKGLVMAGAMFASSVAIYAMLRELSGDDDEDKRLKRMDRRTASERRAYFILPFWDEKKKEPMRFPVGFGLPRLTWGLAVTAVDSMSNPDFDGLDVADGALKSVTSSLSPMQLSDINAFKNTPEFLATTLAPTLTVPVLEMAFNRTKGGSSVFKDNKFSGLPDYAMGFSSTPREWKDAAQFIYDQTSGKVDIAPETMQHLIRAYGGGPATLLINALNSGEKARQGREMTGRDVPIVQAFTGPANRYPERKFREMSQEIGELKKKIKDSEERGTDLGSKLYMDNDKLLQFERDIDAIQREEAKRSREIRTIARTNYDKAAKMTWELEQNMRQQKQQLVTAYAEAKAGGKK